MAGARPHLAAGVQRDAEVVGGTRDFAVEQSGRLPPLGNVRAMAAPELYQSSRLKSLDQPGQEHVLIEAVQAGGGCRRGLSSGSSEPGVTDVAAVVGAEDVGGDAASASGQ